MVCPSERTTETQLIPLGAVARMRRVSNPAKTRGLMLKPIFRPRVRRFVASAMTLVLAVAATGCYNTYSFEREEFAKLQSPSMSETVVQSVGGSAVSVGPQTAVYVRSVGGRRYQVTPFNFKLTASQLVASDRDTLLMVNELKNYEIDHLSTWKTALLLTGAAGAVAGIIVGVIVSASSSTQL